jgi:SAM-dependent methyltransferase
MIKAIGCLETVPDKEIAKAIDIGCGNGYLAAALILKKYQTIGIDIRPEAVYEARKTGVKAYEMDMYDVPNKLGSCFDIAVANLPALRVLGRNNVIYNAGLTGREYIEQFLYLLPFIVKPGGCALTIMSSMNNWGLQVDIINRLGYKYEILRSDKIPLRDELYFEQANLKYAGFMNYRSWLDHWAKKEGSDLLYEGCEILRALAIYPE